MAAEGSLRSGEQAPQLALNMKLLAHNELAGFGGVGEGINLQKAKDGRRILWLAHESAPKNFTAVDVTDPRNPKLVVQTDLPHNDVRSNSLDVVGDIMAVALAYGGMADRPRRAAATERFLLGRRWERDLVERAMKVLETDFTPISDVRGSAEMRTIASKNLLLKFWHETSQR